jgi:hypothetical protein
MEKPFANLEKSVKTGRIFIQKLKAKRRECLQGKPTILRGMYKDL